MLCVMLLAGLIVPKTFHNNLTPSPRLDIVRRFRFVRGHVAMWLHDICRLLGAYGVSAGYGAGAIGSDLDSPSDFGVSGGCIRSSPASLARGFPVVCCTL